MKTLWEHSSRVFAFFVLILVSLPAAGGQTPSQAWSVAYLDQVLAATPAGQRTARVGDMEILVSNLKAWRDELAGAASKTSAFDGTAPTWTDGDVYYAFDTNADTAVEPPQQKVFLDCAAEWASFANLHFIPRTTQSNYVLVSQEAALEGGFSNVGMIGGPQSLTVGPTSWNHATVCHELGHTLGLVHEHQRSDRDNYVTVLSNNIESGEYGNFVLLPDSRNQGAYDFLSVMHYNRNSFAIDTSMDTLEPLPPYIQYLNIMGAQFDPVLSAADRAGMADIYGAGPAVSNVVTNTQDSGPGSLRIALYYAFDHPGTTVTFDISTNDPGFTNNVFTIQPTDRLPSLVNATILDGGSEPVQSNKPGPSVVLNGALAQPPDLYIDGVRLTGTNCAVKNLAVGGFSSCGIEFVGSNTINNAVTGCYLGLDATGSLAETNAYCPLLIDGGACSNVVGGTNAAERNVISGSAFQGLVIRDPGACYNRVIGNYIGLNAAGTAAVSNTWSGVAIFTGAQSNIVGGEGPEFRNIISGNGEQGIVIADTNSTGNIIEGNYIGLDPTGSYAISNTWSGVNLFQGAAENFIGGPGAPNVISGNGEQGILIQDAGSDSNTIQGNLVGLNPSGTAAISNSWAGIEIYNGPQNTLVGGITATARNVISGNNDQGIAIDTGSDGNFVEGNFVGLDISGLHNIPNGFAGVEMFNNANGNVIGGGPGARNYICGNNNAGIAIDSGSASNVVRGNSVGINVANGPAANLYQGVSIFGGAVANQIGGTNLGDANLIAFNTYDAVDMFDSDTSNNLVRGNSMVYNGGGIGLFSGGNLSASAPSLSSAILGTNLVVAGSFGAAPSETYHLDFYASPNPSPEGAVYLGSRDAGTETWTFDFGGVLPEGQVVTVTATDTNGNTSSLSGPLAVTVIDTVGDGIPDAWRSAHFGGNGRTTNSFSCATCDPDSDGMDNLQEFLAGTDPNNPASALRTEVAKVAGEPPAISFESEAGTVYRLDYRDDLGAGFWDVLIDQIEGTGEVIQLTDPSASGLAARFYRLEVLP